MTECLKEVSDEKKCLLATIHFCFMFESCPTRLFANIRFCFGCRFVPPLVCDYHFESLCNVRV